MSTPQRRGGPADAHPPITRRQAHHDQARRQRARSRATLLTLLAVTLVGVTIALGVASLPTSPDPPAGLTAPAWRATG